MALENKIASKNVVLFDLEKYYPKQEDIMYIDIKSFLFKELILKEIEFRAALELIDWKTYTNKNVLVFCSNQAIIPLWSYMIIAAHLSTVGAKVYHDSKTVEEEVLMYNISQIDFTRFKDERVIIKGCSTKIISSQVYMFLSAQFQPFAKTISFGEACSTVPIFRH